MNSRNLLSTLLYALIALLLVVVGYKACQIRKEKDAVLEENRKFDQQLRDMGYTDTKDEGGATEGSAFVGDASTPAKYPDGAEETPTTAPANTDGIENESPKPESKPLSKSSGSQVKDEEGKNVEVSDLDSEMGMSDKPKYMVITGSFRQLANARKEMEALVKKGFADAEVGRFNKGAFACAIALRTNDKKDADATVAKLKKLGFKDATIKQRK